MAREEIDLRSLTFNEMESLIRSVDEPKFRAKQIFNWINKNFVDSFDDMKNVSKKLRAILQEISYLTSCEIVSKLESKIDDTKKYLFKLDDDVVIESVFMKYKHGNTVCISSQAGCRMGCSFCASTANGLKRNLTAGEMVSQISKIQQDVGERISNIVIMGVGEPFDNFDNLVKFFDIINSKEGLNIGMRHITVSTCGLVDGINKFANLDSQVNLAISLHAPNDEIRKQMMPVAKRHSISELLDATKNYANKTKRRVSYEYALIKGVNDSQKCANELGKILRHTLCHVNLIPVNQTDRNDYKKSDQDTVFLFKEILESMGIETTIRREMGSDINAACGQLRLNHIK